MILPILFLLALGTAFSLPPENVATSTNLTGHYVNELGSNMDLVCTGTASAAKLTGLYFSAVGQDQGGYSISGQSTTCDLDALLSFSVAWSNTQAGNSFSATSWSAYVSGSDPMSLSSMWINVRQTEPGDAWQAMTVGSDTFWKVSDEPNSITKATTSTIS